MTSFDWDINEQDTVVITWDDLADGESIVTAEWTVPDELENLAENVVGNQSSIKLRFVGDTYPITVAVRCEITTTGHSSGARKNGETFLLAISQQ